MVGKTLSHYEILEPLGAGGMGEVYLGEDTRLGRKVAVKVLPEEFASDPERLARFEQEARAAAALNHPHIAAVFDVGAETTEGSDVPTHFMVQEYLEGQSLRERLEKGALPLDEALGLAIEVGEALIAAHQARIVHRDLKPDNIFVTEQGHAKVLDFGLAKLIEVAAPSGASASMSPTLLGTVAGQVMGTAGYMAPEQAEGDAEIDHRADVFAFGCVLYEMVSGRQPFAGKSVLDTLHKVVDEEPTPVTEINPAVPAQLQWILDKCLAKNPSRRYQGFADLVVDVRALAADPGATPEASPAGTKSGTRATAGTGRVVSLGLAVTGAAALAVVVALLVWALAGRSAAGPGQVQRFVIIPPPGNFLGLITNAGGVAITPDGTNIVYSSFGENNNELQLTVRPLGTLEVMPLVGLGRWPRGPFTSWDSAWVGYYDDLDDTLKKVSINGGPPELIADLPGNLRGASWGPDGEIVFAVNADGTGLFRVSSGGGDEPVALTTPDATKGEKRHSWPDLLPGGEAVVFTIIPQELADGAKIAVFTPEKQQVTVLDVSGTKPHYSPTGHIVYSAGTAVWAVGFDLDGLEVTSNPVRLISAVATNGQGDASFAFSRTGILVYVPAETDVLSGRDLVWVNRDGQEESVELPRDSYAMPRVSPDGTRIAAWIAGEGGNSDVITSDWVRGTRSNLTTDPAADDTAIWTPDGEHIVFTSRRNGGHRGLFLKSADGSGAAEELFVIEGAALLRPMSWSFDGQQLAFEYSDESAGTLGIYSMSTGQWQPLFEQPTSGRGAAISPDGRWIAYSSDQSGNWEVLVEAFPSLGSRVMVSVGGGVGPRWSTDGAELFYRRVSDGAMMSVSFNTEPSFDPAPPETVFTTRYFMGPSPQTTGRGYDVAQDGRFLMMRMADSREEYEVSRIVVVLNWFEELKQRVPTGR